MKYLNDYMEEKQTKLFKKYKVFFAFNNKQFVEGMKKYKLPKDTKIVSLSNGMYCPEENAENVVKKQLKMYQDAIKEDLKENGKEKVILRELCNHECFYVGSADECVKKLTDYPITEKEIVKVYRDNYKEQSKYF